MAGWIGALDWNKPTSRPESKHPELNTCRTTATCVSGDLLPATTAGRDSGAYKTQKKREALRSSSRTSGDAGSPATSMPEATDCKLAHIIDRIDYLMRQQVTSRTAQQVSHVHCEQRNSSVNSNSIHNSRKVSEILPERWQTAWRHYQWTISPWINERNIRYD